MSFVQYMCMLLVNPIISVIEFTVLSNIIIVCILLADLTFIRTSIGPYHLLILFTVNVEKYPITSAFIIVRLYLRHTIDTFPRGIHLHVGHEK